VAPIKRAAPFFAMIVLTLSAMFAAIVLGVVINQGVSGPPSEGVAGLAIAIAFVVAWFIASILLLERVLKRTLRQRQNRNFSDELHDLHRSP
jgi:ABC-type multidrug transport system fused ATPase/permease subunit